MPFQGTFFNVMVGSPSDVASALSVVREALARWNVMHSEERGVVLLPMSWRTNSSPELGSPAQAVINRQLIGRSDLLIAVFWTRLGTPTGEADSGTIEEILKHIEQGKPVMLYFCEKDIPFSQLDHDQHAKLKEFRSKVEGLYDTFKTDDELREKVERHLNDKVQNHPGFSVARVSRSPVVEEPPQPAISKEALEILILATKDPNAFISKVRTPEGVVIGTMQGGRPASNARESAKNERIIRELENAGFIQNPGTDRDFFQVTAEGFEYVDKNEPAPTTGPANISFVPTHPKNTMSEDVRQALDLIRQKGPQIPLAFIQNIHERGIIEYLTHYAIDRSHAVELWQTMRVNAINQLGIIPPPTTEQIDHESERLFHLVVKHHFPELSESQINALFQAFEEMRLPAP